MNEKETIPLFKRFETSSRIPKNKGRKENKLDIVDIHKFVREQASVNDLKVLQFYINLQIKEKNARQRNNNYSKKKKPKSNNSLICKLDQDLDDIHEQRHNGNNKFFTKSKFIN